MNDSNSEFARLIEELGGGSDEAAMQLLDTYGHHVYRVVRRRLARELRPKFDSADFVQAVWASFFANIDRISDFESPERLVAFLSGMASNKVIDEVRRRLVYEQHNIHKEVSMNAANDSTEYVFAGNDPTPSQIAVAHEEKERMFLNQPSHYRRMIEMRLDGAAFVEIAESLKVNERTVRRVFEKLSKRMQGRQLD